MDEIHFSDNKTSSVFTNIIHPFAGSRRVEYITHNTNILHINKVCNACNCVVA